ncbi:zinc-ribbon domain containing protein [Aureivirga sp. CE67]|uniref:zinc-ribbon domain containing protein n=1 Tax=Aureivirga sp. CE67 TaxID=1788983 RepID=UPI0018CB117A|nr:zinc-ribbon domain containing protein [Aureivirga sp. CE67]
MKKEKEFPICPSCRNGKYQSEMEKSISAYVNHERKLYKHYNELDLNPYESFFNSNFDWACDNCINANKTLKANPELQNGSWISHFFYSDLKLVCSTCKTDFTFFKEEKQFWYEEMQFKNDNRPINCVKCRKEKRLRKNENTLLSDIFKKEEKEISISDLEKAIEIYLKWDKIEKVKFYQNKLKKKLKN